MVDINDLTIESHWGTHIMYNIYTCMKIFATNIMHEFHKTMIFHLERLLPNIGLP
jgi:hypothetical protein